MSNLPKADAVTDAAIRAWLERFAEYVRSVDYESAKPMWDEDVVVFGTHNDLVHGLDRAVASQWSNVWPRTSDFRFTLEHTEVFGAGNIAVAAAPWTSTGYAPDGTKFDRPGRATLMFAQRVGQWRCVHSHMSLNRGVPQTSHADRPVAGR